MAIPEGHHANFQTIANAFHESRVALMEVTRNSDGSNAYLLCAVNHLPDGQVEMVPLAQMLDGNPYEDFTPPV